MIFFTMIVHPCFGTSEFAFLATRLLLSSPRILITHSSVFHHLWADEGRIAVEWSSAFSSFAANSPHCTYSQRSSRDGCNSHRITFYQVAGSKLEYRICCLWPQSIPRQYLRKQNRNIVIRLRWYADTRECIYKLSDILRSIACVWTRIYSQKDIR